VEKGKYHLVVSEKSWEKLSKRGWISLKKKLTKQRNNKCVFSQRVKLPFTYSTMGWVVIFFLSFFSMTGMLSHFSPRRTVKCVLSRHESVDSNIFTQVSISICIFVILETVNVKSVLLQNQKALLPYIFIIKCIANLT
jgi:hypothetical protein